MDKDGDGVISKDEWSEWCKVRNICFFSPLVPSKQEKNIKTETV